MAYKMIKELMMFCNSENCIKKFLWVLKWFFLHRFHESCIVFWNDLSFKVSANNSFIAFGSKTGVSISSYSWKYFFYSTIFRIQCHLRNIKSIKRLSEDSNCSTWNLMVLLWRKELSKEIKRQLTDNEMYRTRKF